MLVSAAPGQIPIDAPRIVTPDTIDWQNPDYLPIWKKRAERLSKLRADPELLQRVKFYYRNGHFADFINDWGVTVDPRIVGRPTIMPMMLWPKQRAFIDFLYRKWREGDDGTCVKSRDVGISWLAMGFAGTLCIFYDDVSVGFGSEKEDKVDRSGDPDCLFYKGRMFLQYLPDIFRAGWNLKQYSAHMRLTFPQTGSSITGEAGNNIGRGGRKALYLVDESAHIPNPKAIDASLSANTNSRIDMSSVCGMANSFAERAHNPAIERFDFAWQDDPRKDAAWERKKRATLDPVIFAQEYDRNFTASIEGQVIPTEWVAASINAHLLFGLKPQGVKRGTLDVADAGRDANAFCIGHSFLVETIESWRGSADLDIYNSVEQAFLLCDTHGLPEFYYDADGLGAGVRGDARKVNEARLASGSKMITVLPFRGSGEVFEPESIVPGTERTALDFFENAKAQAWWMLRAYFQYTYRAVEAFKRGDVWVIDPSQFISIAGDFTLRARLTVELSQPVWALSKNGKVMVDKCPVGTKTEVRNSIASPNLADAVMMLRAPRYGVLSINPALLAATSGSHRR
jgi:phage terminase large subunit